jgi:hypothetical protein
MLVYYRLSDKNRRGKAPSYFTNENCLNNFLKNFYLDKNEIILICDNISDETESWIKKYNLNYIKTNLGNSGSFDFCLNHAIKNLNDDDLVYFVENDYLHRPESRKVLEEAFSTFNADYVSLYDSPEKYENHYNVNYKNFVNFSFGIFENFKSKIYCGLECYWRTSNSFTMTFATKIKILKDDYDIFKYNIHDIGEKSFEYRTIPRDYELFLMLNLVRNRNMVTPMPGYCTHGDLLSPYVDWKKYYE